MGSIELKKVEKWFNEVNVIKGIDLKISNGEFLVLVGPSGCGKSTLLRMIGGLEDTSRGEIFINGQEVTNRPPSKRGLSMVFQSYALYPHLSVEGNMGFPLKTAGEKNNVIKDRVSRVAKVLKLENYLNRLPKTLSGGQRQRVAIGRSIIRNPTAFLFDEPLSNLDAALRVDMRLELAKLHQELKATMIYVTHDQVEAMTLADKIVVLNNGIIEQVGSPVELYNTPRNLFVAEFIGSPKMNILNLQNQNDIFTHNLQIPNNASMVGVRPEHLIVSSEKEAKFHGDIRHIENLGEHLLCYLNSSSGKEIIAKLDINSNINVNDNIYLSWDISHTHFFNSKENAVA